MVEMIILLAIIVPLLVALYVMPYWIRKMHQIGLTWRDMNKSRAKKVAGSGGTVVVFGFILGIFLYIAIRTFYLQTTDNLIEILAVASSVLLLAGVGLIDDLFGWQKGGLSKRSRLVMVAFAAIPLIVINAGNPGVYIPFIDEVVNIGLLYPLIVIPIGIIGSTVTFNFLAGYNGLEAGQGIILLLTLSIVSFLTGSSWLGVVGLTMVSALIGFFIFNKYPARVFPGDVLTYPIGALIAIMAILGNYELFAVFIFLPYIAETILKLRGGLKKASFGEPQTDGSLKNAHGKIYGLEHLFIRFLEKTTGKAYEWEVAFLIHGLQIIIVILGFMLVLS